MKTYRVNPEGLRQIREHLASRHKLGGDHFTRDMLHAWADDVERNLSKSGAAEFEIRSWDTVSGHAELCRITPEGLDAEEVPEA